MLVKKLLLDTLEDLGGDDFRTFKWYLSMDILDGCRPIPKSRLENANLTETVDKITETYEEELAVKITAEILRKTYQNNAAQNLMSRYAEGNAAASSSSSTSTSSAVAPPAPAPLMAQQGGVIIAPTLTSGTTGSWNITITK
uniref:caspase b isoform X2 n=1 Tax=Scatophagus argus TaxID=75038 RepID=UPI001ED80618|nr:caspase b isoform X2 [Scatophagus argus]